MSSPSSRSRNRAGTSQQSTIGTLGYQRHGSSRGSSRVTFSQNFQQLYRKLKPVVPIVAVTVIGGILACIFEYLPHPEGGQRQTFGQICRDLFFQAYLPLHGSYFFVSSKLHRMSYIMPPWVPLWSIRRPREVFDTRVPRASLIEADARIIYPYLKTLTAERYFRIFKIDFSAQCPFWVRDDVCSSSSGSCSVCHCDDAQIPEAWKDKPVEQFVDRRIDQDVNNWGGEFDVDSLDLMTERSDAWRGPGNLFDSISDEHSKKESATYVDLSLNRPKNTGYSRTPIWSYIYKENCMGDLSNPLAAEGPGSDKLTNQCTEEESFYKLISGLQSCITALLAENYNTDLPATTHSPFQRLLWKVQPRFEFSIFKRGFANTPEYTENMYFGFSLLMRALCQSQSLLRTCDCQTGITSEAVRTRQLLMDMVSKSKSLHSCDEQFAVEPIFQRKTSLALRQFRNITRIMDCVECESCRLHGKIKVLALYLALKSTSGPNSLPSIERNELIALVNGARYFAEAILSFKQMEYRLTLLRAVWIFAGLTLLCSLGYGTSKVSTRSPCCRRRKTK